MHKMHAIVQLTIYVHSIKVSALLDCLVSTYCLPEVINYICSSRHIIHPAEAVVSILSDLLSYSSPNWTWGCQEECNYSGRIWLEGSIESGTWTGKHAGRGGWLCRGCCLWPPMWRVGEVDPCRTGRGSSGIGLAAYQAAQAPNLDLCIGALGPVSYSPFWYCSSSAWHTPRYSRRLFYCTDIVLPWIYTASWSKNWRILLWICSYYVYSLQKLVVPFFLEHVDSLL